MLFISDHVLGIVLPPLFIFNTET